MDTRCEQITLLELTKGSKVSNPIRELQKKLPITDGGILVDEFGHYKEIAMSLGLELTQFRGKLAYKIVNSKEEDELN